MKTAFLFSRRSIVVLAASSSIAFFACKKEETTADVPAPDQQPQSTMYNLPLTAGSYWIYASEKTDSLGNIITPSGIDSIFVGGDSTIGSITYKKVCGIHISGTQHMLLYPLQLLRDSAGYHVDETGAFIQHDNFTDTIGYYGFPNYLDVWYFMRNPDSLVTVPAGTFTTINYEGDMYSADPNYPFVTPRHTNLLFANNVGKIFHRLFYTSQPGYVQHRLLRYHIQ
ncbi:MAG: hypothetical protein ACRCYO_07190 [Bacteroidia bacterium]